MKIIHYIPSINKRDGGTTAYMQLLSKSLGTLVQLHIVTHRSDNDVEIEYATVHYISSSLRGDMKKEWDKLLDAVKPCLVHINCCWLPACALTQKWAQKKGYPIVLTPHGMLEPWIMKRNYWTKKLPALFLYQKAAVKKADFIHATAESEKNNLLELGYNSQVQIIPNGIETDNISIKKSWKKTNNLLFLSRVHEKKGIELLLQAVAELGEQMAGIKVTIAGEGEDSYVKKLTTLAKERGLEKVVFFVGGVYGEKKWQLFREADIFILPTYSENFGIVVAEALASGTPVITTTGTPWQELVDNQCGWWVEANVVALKAAIKEAISLSSEKLENYGIRARKMVEERYSISTVSKDMVALYSEVLFNK